MKDVDRNWYLIIRKQSKVPWLQQLTMLQSFDGLLPLMPKAPNIMTIDKIPLIFNPLIYLQATCLISPY